MKKVLLLFFVFLFLVCFGLYSVDFDYGSDFDILFHNKEQNVWCYSKTFKIHFKNNENNFNVGSGIFFLNTDTEYVNFKLNSGILNLDYSNKSFSIRNSFLLYDLLEDIAIDVDGKRFVISPRNDLLCKADIKYSFSDLLSLKVYGMYTKPKFNDSDLNYFYGRPSDFEFKSIGGNVGLPFGLTIAYHRYDLKTDMYSSKQRNLGSAELLLNFVCLKNVNRYFDAELGYIWAKTCGEFNLPSGSFFINLFLSDGKADGILKQKIIFGGLKKDFSFGKDKQFIFRTRLMYFYCICSEQNINYEYTKKLLHAGHYSERLEIDSLENKSLLYGNICFGFRNNVFEFLLKKIFVIPFDFDSSESLDINNYSIDDLNSALLSGLCFSVKCKF